MDTMARTKLIPSKHENPSGQAPVFNFREFISENRNIFILLFVLVFVVYFNSIGNGFVSDDVRAIKENPDIAYLESVFSSPMGIIQRGIYFFDAFIFGLRPSIFRITNNLIFHVGNTFLVFLLLSLLSRRKPLAVFAAGLFAIHPILTEAVVWISGSLYVQGTFFALLSIITYILFKDAENWKRYLHLIFFILAISSSPVAIMVPFIILLKELSFGELRENWKKIIPGLTVILITSVFFSSMVLQRFEANQAVADMRDGSFRDPLFQIPLAVANYLYLIFWPNTLSFYQTDLFFPIDRILFVSLFFILIPSILFYSWKKNREVFFWLSFFLLSLVPFLFTLRITWVFAERYVYFGSIGIFVLVASFFNRLLGIGKKYATPVYIVFAVIIALLSLRTIFRNNDWKNADSLWIATSKTSSSYAAHNNLGGVYQRQGDWEKAINEFRLAIELYPGLADAYFNLGESYKQIGQTDKAIESFKRAVELNPRDWQSSQMISAIYFEKGDYQKSLEYIEKALKINPGDKILQNGVKIIQSKIK